MSFRLPPPSDERSLNRRYLTLVGLQEFAVLLPLVVLIVHMAERGLGLGLIGAAFAVRSIIVVLLEVPTGGLADAVGRKPIALWSQAFTLASMVALLFVTDVFTVMTYAVLQGIGSALHSGALEAWYVDALQRISPGTDLQKNLAQVVGVEAVALVVGSVLGGLLPTWASGWNLPYPLSAFGISLFVGILLRLLVWLLTYVVVEEAPYTGGTIAGFKAVPGIIRDALELTRTVSVVPYLLVAMLVNGVALISLQTFWQPVISETLNASAENSGAFAVFGTLTGMAAMLGSFVVMRGAGKLFSGGRAGLAGLSQLLKGLGIVLLGASTSGLNMGLGLAIAFFAVATNSAPHMTLLNEAVPSERRSVMLSINSLALFLGTALGAGLLGSVAAAIGPRIALLIAGGFTAIASLIYLGVATAQRRQAEALILESLPSEN